MYLVTAIVIAVICLFAFGISGDIHAGERSADARNAAVKSEKIPGIHRKSKVLISAAGSNRPVSVYTEKIFGEYSSLMWVLPVPVCFSV